MVNLPAGDVDLEYTWWEGTGGASLEVYASPGNLTSVGGTFQLIGNTAAGGLEIVNDSTTVPTLTANGNSSLSVVGGVPSTFTLAWGVVNPTSVLSINQGIGAVAQVGSRILPSPAVNDFGTASGRVTISLPTPIGVDASGFTARRVSATSAFPFAGQSYLASAVSLLGGQNAGATTSQGGYTTINFNDGADGDFTTGNIAFPGGGGDHFAVEITGTLVVNAPGEYDFIVNCDDGCRLRIDGVDVIVDDANHSPTASSGRFTFTKPTAQFELIYYDAIGGASCEMSWIRPNLSWQLLDVITPAAPIVRGGLIISEFAASGSTLKDEDATTQDWIEVWNSSASPVDLTGHYLSTAAATPAQWAFPNKVLAPDEYLIVFASEKNRVDPLLPLHTNFKLPATGAYLALKKDDGSGGYVTLTEFNPYPAQVSGGSYGSSDLEGYIGFIETPTPGAPNAATYIGFLEEVSFSTPRGRYSTAFDLTLSSITPGAEIRYTLDGSSPTPNHGTIYTAENNRFPSLQGDPVWDRCVIPHLGYTNTLTGTGDLKPSAFRGLEGVARIFASTADKQTRPKDTYKRSVAIVPWTTNWSNGTAFRGWKDLPYNKGIRYSMLNSPEKAAMVVQWYEGTSGISNNLGHGNHAFHDMGGPQKLLGNYQQVLFADGHIEKISARMKNADFVAKYWPGTIGNVNSTP